MNNRKIQKLRNNLCINKQTNNNNDLILKNVDRHKSKVYLLNQTKTIYIEHQVILDYMTHIQTHVVILLIHRHMLFPMYSLSSCLFMHISIFSIILTVHSFSIIYISDQRFLPLANPILGYNVRVKLFLRKRKYFINLVSNMFSNRKKSSQRKIIFHQL